VCRLTRLRSRAQGASFPALRYLAQPPARIIATRIAWLDEAEGVRCRQVGNSLTERQREVLRLIANGHSPQSVAEQLSISLKTVDSHKTAILGECRVAWSLPEDSWLNYHFLRDKFGPFRDELS